MIELVIRDRDSDHYDPKTRANRKLPPVVRVVQRHGKMYEICGSRYEMFGIKIFAQALDRTILTIRKLEKDGTIPPALFHVDKGKSSNRLYTSVQLVNINRLLWHKYKFLRSGVSSKRLIGPMWEEVRQVFYASTIIVDSNGEIIR